MSGAASGAASEALAAAARRIIAVESRAFADRTAASQVAHERALAVMPLGVPANGQVFPAPIVAASAKGSHLVDLDGNRYVDFNMGYGALFIGHGHPVVMSAVRAQLDRGTIYLMPCEENDVVARALRDRFAQSLWRFTNSGTEATMPALRAARSFTDRAVVVKTDGGYHGQYDSMLTGIRPSTGVPAALTALTRVVPFNDADAMAQALARRDVACVIVEPALQNAGIVLPASGYLARLRELCDATGTLLVFDEVKIGITAHWGGATTLYGVQPDLVAVSKSIGGGLPIGALGGRADVMAELSPQRATQVGTFSGNPLAMAAARATLCDVCTPAATGEAIARSTRLADGLRRALGADLPAHVVQMGAKGCVLWEQPELRRTMWFWLANRGVLTPPSGDFQWLVSLQHSDADIDHAIAVFADFATELAR